MCHFFLVYTWCHFFLCPFSCAIIPVPFFPVPFFQATLYEIRHVITSPNPLPCTVTGLSTHAPDLPGSLSVTRIQCTIKWDRHHIHPQFGLCCPVVNANAMLKELLVRRNWFPYSLPCLRPSVSPSLHPSISATASFSFPLS